MKNNLKNLVIYDNNKKIIGSVREKTYDEVNSSNKKNMSNNKEKVLKKTNKH